MDYITQTSATDIFVSAQAKAVLPQEAVRGIMEISWRYIMGMSRLLGGFKYFDHWIIVGLYIYIYRFYISGWWFQIFQSFSISYMG